MLGISFRDTAVFNASLILFQCILNNFLVNILSSFHHGVFSACIQFLTMQYTTSIFVVMYFTIGFSKTAVRELVLDSGIRCSLRTRFGAMTNL